MINPYYEFATNQNFIYEGCFVFLFSLLVIMKILWLLTLDDADDINGYLYYIFFQFLLIVTDISGPIFSIYDYKYLTLICFIIEFTNLLSSYYFIIVCEDNILYTALIFTIFYYTIHIFLKFMYFLNKIE